FCSSVRLSTSVGISGTLRARFRPLALLTLTRARRSLRFVRASLTPLERLLPLRPPCLPCMAFRRFGRNDPSLPKPALRAPKPPLDLVDFEHGPPGLHRPKAVRPHDRFVPAIGVLADDAQPVVAPVVRDLFEPAE